MAERIEIGGLKVARGLYDVVRDEIAPGTDVDPAKFWTAFAAVVRDLEPTNRKLLDRRNSLQEAIDAWHSQRRGRPFDRKEYEAFLREIRYLVPEEDDFEITVGNVDPEIAEVAPTSLRRIFTLSGDKVPSPPFPPSPSARDNLPKKLFDSLIDESVLPLFRKDSSDLNIIQQYPQTTHFVRAVC